jgi:hypothetical protein
LRASRYRLQGGSSWWPFSLTLLSVFGSYRTFADYWRGHGPLSTSGVDFGLFGHSSDKWKQEDRPDLQLHGMPTAGDKGLYV